MHSILCISSYYKGVDFMIKSKELGNHVILVTSESLRNEDWPWDSIDEVFYMEEIQPFKWNLDHLILGVANYMRSRKIDAVVALDDFDVEKAAKVRENFRIPGMGQTRYRYFRDKLAMREKAKEEKIAIPKFIGVFNDETVNQFADEVAPPWVLKPRTEASATGIIKINSKEELWKYLHETDNERHKYLLEQFRPGDIYHVDSLVFNGKVLFSCASKYVNPPMAVSQDGGVFMTASMNPKLEESKNLIDFNNNLLIKFGLKHGATHSEFIKDKETGELLFLETASRVGGAFIPNMVEQATGINLWHEWAKIEHSLLNNEKYKLPKKQNNFGGLLISLCKVENPDLSFIQDKEFVQQLKKPYHVGMLFKSKKQDKIEELLEKYALIVTHEMLQIIPPKDYPTS